MNHDFDHGTCIHCGCRDIDFDRRNAPCPGDSMNAYAIVHNKITPGRIVRATPNMVVFDPRDSCDRLEMVPELVLRTRDIFDDATVGAWFRRYASMQEGK